MMSPLPKPVSVRIKVPSCVGTVCGDGAGREVTFNFGDEFVQKGLAGANLAVVEDSRGQNFAIESHFIEETTRRSLATESDLVAV